jgi:myo-inositol 2-dehydrogenase / D-chiro-inositol 1-dehydrogenase
MPHRDAHRRVSRRTFVGGSLVAATAAALPRGGVFAGGSDTIRIGVAGCGGRGTGAAIHAALADPGVVITALGDLFADELASSAERLAAVLGSRFSCPTEARFTGTDAAERAIRADVDAVILATPPHLRPMHLAAAVAAGRHVYCETPAAVDAPGVRDVLAITAEAERRGLSIVAGLRWRRDPASAATIARLRDGAVGRVIGASAITIAAPAWRRQPRSGWTAAETRQRHWIADEGLSGGPLVEYQLHALDRAVWALGDDLPMAAVATRAHEPLPALPPGSPRPVAARLLFADGRWLDVAIERRAGVETGSTETVVGTAGVADLRAHVVAGRPISAAGPAGDPLAASAAALVRSLRGAERIDDLPLLCRSTLAAVLARDAAAAAGPVRVDDLGIAGTALRSLRPVQWDAV